MKIKHNLDDRVICNSTDSAIKRFNEHYGQPAKDNLIKFFGLSEKEWREFKPVILNNLPGGSL